MFVHLIAVFVILIFALGSQGIWFAEMSLGENKLDVGPQKSDELLSNAKKTPIWNQ